MTEEQDRSPSVREEAAQWLVRLRSGDATSGDRRRLESWLAEDARHRREFERVSGMWSTMIDAKPLFEAEIRKAEGQWARYGASFERRSRWASVRLLAAGVVATLVMITFLWWTISEPARYQTIVGEQRQLTLADGSSVTLNTNTKLATQFSRRARTVRLEQGEAWFTIAPDRRPFHVEVANGVIHDIGTQFIVNKLPEKVEVSVLDGLVEVKVSSSADRPAVLRRGERVSYGVDGRMSDIGSFDHLTAGAWKDGKLIFKGRPLVQVLTELARYRPEEIRLVDRTLEDIPVTGVFNIRELDNSLDLLQEILPIQVQHVTLDLILIVGAPSFSAAPHSSSR